MNVVKSARSVIRKKNRTRAVIQILFFTDLDDKIAFHENNHIK